MTPSRRTQPVGARRRPGGSAGLAWCWLAVAASVSAAWAGPAPWYQWRSELNGQTLCAQASPGTAWVRQDGPYQDSNCRRPPPRRQPM